MIAVSEALDRLRATACVFAAETVALDEAHGRVLATAIAALVDNPPWDAAAMDGYAIRQDAGAAPLKLLIAGEAAAGRRLLRGIGPGETARIFTGAALPDGAARVVVQENAVVLEGGHVRLTDFGAESHVRPRGADFRAGDVLLAAPHRLGAADLMLAAAAGHSVLPVHRRPRIAILPTGDEVANPGEPLAGDRIVSSVPVGLAAIARVAGAIVQTLPVVPDIPDAFDALLPTLDADIVVTVGGASVGDHDLVWPALLRGGFAPVFRQVAMRPGKPTSCAVRDGQIALALPGNPVSALVSAQLFLSTLVHLMQGLHHDPLATHAGHLAAPLPANGPRHAFLRATQAAGLIHPADSQDSGFLRAAAAATVLVSRPPFAAPASAGDCVRFMYLAD